MSVETFVQYVIMPILFVAYFIPAFIGRKKCHSGAILCLNVFLGWTIIGWAAALVWALKSGAAPVKVPTHVCVTCGSQVRPTSVTPGTMLMELVLWLCFIIPGLIYSIWRIASRHDGCPVCGATTLVPLDTPAAMRILSVNASASQSVS